MITRNQLPEEVRDLAKWVHFWGTGTNVLELFSKEPRFVPKVYGWQISTRDTQFVYGHPVLQRLKALGFRHHGRKWNLVLESDPDCLKAFEPE